MATNIYSLIDSGKIPEAIALLRKAAAGYPALLDRLDSIETTFRYMLEYFLDGLRDDSRAEIYADIQAGLRYVARRISIERRQPDDTSTYFAARRMEKSRPVPLSSLVDEYMRLHARACAETEEGAGPSAAARREMEQLLDRIFTKAWILDLDSREQLKAVAATLSAGAPFRLVSQVAVGRTLGALAYCDPASLAFLLDLYDSTADDRLAARLLTCIVLVLHTWPRIVTEDRRLQTRLDLMADSLVDYTRLRDVLMNLIRTRDTDRVARKMKEDLLPSLTQTSPEIMKRLSELGSGAGDLSELEENPEWRKIIRESGIEKKMQELTEMQTEGLDVMMQAFSNLKQFAFFREASHWFLPFDPELTDLSRLTAAGGSAMLPMLGEAAGFCDSDRYSLAFSLLQMPTDRMMAVSSQFQGALDQLREAMEGGALPKARTDFNDESLKFCRDLYRFFRLYPRREDYVDVFARPFDFGSTPLVGRLLAEPEILSLLAEFYFKAEYYGEACALFEKLTELGSVDGHIMEKIGYCRQVAGDHAGALEYYEKAELFASEPGQVSLWLLRKMALCCKLLGRFAEAAGYYARALGRRPDSRSLLLNLAAMQMESGDREEALRNYHKAEYQMPDDPATLRGVAAGEMRAGEYGKAEEKLLRLSLLTEMTPEDHRMAGHVAWLRGQRRRARDEYRLSGVDADDAAREMRRLQGDAFDPLAFTLLFA